MILSTLLLFLFFNQNGGVNQTALYGSQQSFLLHNMPWQRETVVGQ